MVQRILIGLVVTGAAVAAAHGAAVERDDWFEIRLPEARILSATDRARTEGLARQLDRLRQVLATVLPFADAGTSKPTLVYVFKDSESFRDFTRELSAPHRVGGVYLNTREAHFILLSAGQDVDLFGLAFHEWIHRVVDERIPGLPLWINEGIAEYFSTFSADAFDARLGAPIDDYLSLLRTRPMIPFRRFVVADVDSELYRRTADKAVFHAQSWLLVHYLMHGEDDSLPSLHQLLGRAQTDGAPVTLSVSGSWSQLDRRLQEYAARESLPLRRFRLEGNGAVSRPEIRYLERYEAMAELARVLALGRDRALPRADKLLRRALGIAPRHVPALVALGQVRTRQQRFAEAEQLFARAIAVEPDYYRAHYLRGQNLLQQARARGETPALPVATDTQTLQQSRAAFARTVELAPDFAEGYVGFGVTALFDPARRLEALAALQRARALLPHRSEIVYYEVIALLRVGRRSAALELWHDTLTRQGGNEWFDRAERAIAAQDLRRAHELVRGGRSDQGARVLERSLTEFRTPELRRQLERVLQDVRTGPR